MDSEKGVNVGMEPWLTFDFWVETARYLHRHAGNPLIDNGPNWCLVTARLAQFAPSVEAFEAAIGDRPGVSSLSDGVRRRLESRSGSAEQSVN
ncbi:MAG: hypothetical protein ABIJ46_02020 [bacterium]